MVSNRLNILSKLFHNQTANHYRCRGTNRCYRISMKAWNCDNSVSFSPRTNMRCGKQRRRVSLIPSTSTRCFDRRRLLLQMINPLTPTVAIWVQSKAIKHPVQEGVKPSCVIYAIRALSRSALSVRVLRCQKLQMTA